MQLANWHLSYWTTESMVAITSDVYLVRTRIALEYFLINKSITPTYILQSLESYSESA